MSTTPPSEPQPPTNGEGEAQARAEAASPEVPAGEPSASAADHAAAAAAERAAPPQPAAPSWQEPTPYRPTYPPGQQYPPYQPPPPPQRRSRWHIWLIGGCLALLALCVLACAVLGGVFAGFLIHVANQVSTSTTTTQTFSVTGTPSLDIKDTAGNVEVVTGDAGTVNVEVTKRARATTRDEADSDLNSIRVDVTQVGNTIRVTTSFDEGNGLARQRRVDLTITVPPTANVTAQVTAGQVSISDVGGLFDVSVLAGDLEMKGVTLADGSRLHVTTGDAQLSGTIPTGASLDVSVDTGEASLELPASTAAHLDARTNIGSIDVSGWNLSASKQNVGASAVGDLGTNPQGSITVRVQTGDIKISQA
jgi:hypothetical protein